MGLKLKNRKMNLFITELNNNKMNRLDESCISLIYQFVGFENKKVFKKVLKELKIVHIEDKR